MELDTHVKGLLDMLAASGQPKMWEVPPAEARKMALALTQMVEGKEPIGKIDNGSLPGRSGSIPFRIYTPVAASAMLNLFSWRGLDIWRPGHCRLYVPYVGERERLPGHLN